MRFICSNMNGTERLQEKMSDEERETFDFTHMEYKETNFKNNCLDYKIRSNQWLPERKRINQILKGQFNCDV